MDGWQLPDTETARDLATFLGRAVRLDSGAAVRLHAVGSIAAVYLCPIHGAGLPTVLGLRTIALAEPSNLDAVVSCQSMLDRLARAEHGTWLPKPPVDLHAAWAGVLPPRAGWSGLGRIDGDRLRSVAEAGIREIASGTPEYAGSSAVAKLRAMVWSRPVPITPAPEAANRHPEVPAGAAFGAHALGFLRAGGQVTVTAAGPWTRLDADAGYILTRRSPL